MSNFFSEQVNCNCSRFYDDYIESHLNVMKTFFAQLLRIVEHENDASKFYELCFNCILKI